MKLTSERKQYSENKAIELLNHNEINQAEICKLYFQNS